MTSVSLEYDLSGADLADLSRHAAELCSELDRPGILREQLKTIGIDAAKIEKFSGLATVEPAAHGLDYTTVGAVVTLSLPFAKAGAKVTTAVLLDIWKKILLPRLKQRMGEDWLIDKAEQKKLQIGKADKKNPPKIEKAEKRKPKQPPKPAQSSKKKD